MSVSKRLAGVSAELRASAFHFTVYLSNGAAAVYLAIWLQGQGISTDEIGIINAVPVFVMLAINVFVGRIADKAKDWRSVIAVMAVLAGLVPFALFFVGGFWGILIVWTLLMVPAGSLPPVVDAATLRMTQRRGSDFGFIRAWGTVGYMGATAVAGLLIAFYGPGAFVPMFVIFSLLRAALSLQLPRFRAPAEAPTLAALKPAAGKLRDVLKPWFVLPLVAFALSNATHAIFTAFAALVWSDLGISAATIGQLIAVGAAAEATMMFVWKRIGKRVSARHMILAAALVTVFRWAMMGLNPPVAALFGLQLLHSITYAVGYFGTVHFIANWTSEEIAAEAQGFAFVLQQGVTVVALISFGWLVAFLDERAFFVAALLGLLAAVLVTVSLKIMPIRSEVQRMTGA